MDFIEIGARLKPPQRQQMIDHFGSVPAHAFYAACVVYLGREFRFAARHRDYQGIADLQRMARLRGLSSQFEAAACRVDVEIWSDIPPLPESIRRPAWETDPKSRDEYPREWWESKPTARDHDGYDGPRPQTEAHVWRAHMAKCRSLAANG